MDKDNVAALGWQFDAPLAEIGLASLGPARLLGEILGDSVGLSPARVREILEHASQQGMRFGDAAVALGYASRQQVVQALSTQFDYPCVADDADLDNPELVMLARPHSAQAEAIRGIRSQVARRMARTNRAHRSLANLSPQPGDGKTFLVANLAVAFAQTGARTLVVDADMRGPRLHEVFGVTGRNGLSSALAGRGGGQVIQPVRSVPGLHVLPCGITPPNPLELIERDAFGRLMAKLPEHFDHVLVDTPAAAYGADALAIAERCGASLLLARRNHASLASLRQLVDELDDGPGGLVGTLVNDF
jgi:chain length determinant protein tyrosine kinase EpsG